MINVIAVVDFTKCIKVNNSKKRRRVTEAGQLIRKYIIDNNQMNLRNLMIII